MQRLIVLEKSSISKLAMATMALIVLIFIMDTQVSLGVAGAVPYVVVVLLGLWYPDKQHIIALAVITSMATALGYFLSPSGGVEWMVIANRCLALFAIWVCAFVLFMYKTKQKELEYEKLRVETYLEISEAIIVQLDIEHRVMLINQRGCEVLGYTANELIGQDWLELCIEKKQRGIIDGVHISVVSQESPSYQHFENDIVTKSGEHRCITWNNKVVTDDNGVVIGTLSSGQDITERRLVEQNLRDAHDQLGQKKLEPFLKFYWETNVAIYIAQGGKIQVANPAMVEMFGYPEAVLTSKSFTEFIHPNDRKIVADRHRMRTQGEDVPSTYSFKIINAEGDCRHVELNVVGVTWKEQPATFCAQTDITTRKLAEDKLREAHNELDQKVRERTKELEKAIDKAQMANDLKTQLVTTMSHELRTPLTSIVGSLRLLREDKVIEDTEIRADLLEMAWRNSVQLTKLADDIINAERLDAGVLEITMQSLDMAELVQKASDLNAGYAAEKEVTIIAQDLDFNSMVVGDEVRLMQVMANLLSNAAKFSPKKGIITTSVKRVEGVVKVSVSDNGPGIPYDIRNTIFGKFVRGENKDSRNVGGAGLGLNIAKAIVEKHGGNIDFESEVGAGTTFFFTIPATE